MVLGSPLIDGFLTCAVEVCCIDETFRAAYYIILYDIAIFFSANCTWKMSLLLLQGNALLQVNKHQVLLLKEMHK
jgi:hypothetical protein